MVIDSFEQRVRHPKDEEKANENYSGKKKQITRKTQAYPDTVQPGAPLTYTIRITDTFDVPLHATITDTLPTHVTPGQTSGGALALPGGTVLLPDGAIAVTWTAVWTGTLRVTVDEEYEGPLTNLVEVMTKEGVVGRAIVIVNAHKIYLPLVMRNFP